MQVEADLELSAADYGRCVAEGELGLAPGAAASDFAADESVPVHLHVGLEAQLADTLAASDDAMASLLSQLFADGGPLARADAWQAIDVTQSAAEGLQIGYRLSEAADPRAIFDLHLERIYLRSLALASLARGETPIPDWLPTQLDELEQLIEQAGMPVPMAELATRLDLAPIAVELLWSLAAVAVEARAQVHLRAVFGDEARRGLSAGGFAALFQLGADAARELIALLDEGHALFRHHIVDSAGPHITAATPLSVPRRIVDHLRGDDAVDAAITTWGGLLSPPASARMDARQRDELARLSGCLAADQRVVITVEGPTGAGRRSAVAMAAAQLGRQAVAIDGQLVPGSVEHCRSALEAIHRECVLRDAIPVLANVEELANPSSHDDPRTHLVASFVRARTGPTVITSGAGGIDLGIDRPVVRVNWSLADHATRRELWADALGDRAAALDSELGLLAHRFRIGPGGIERAVESARLMSARREGGDAIDERDLVMGVRSNITEQLGSLASRIDVVESWDDLVLPEDSLETIHRLIQRVRYSHKVYEEWGFRRRASRGTGVPVLFSGPPGTGKTMVAGIIARELDLDLFQIDLSRIVSKWVGETEKNLGQVFEAAEAGHGLLLFDEADALFAKRSTDVKGAQDRYANLEVNYLLQRIEAFAGIAILTTNLDTSIDKALKRRLAAHVIFYAPDEDERLELWRRMLSNNDAPVDRESLDLESLSRDYPDMSGAHIRNAVLAAAFLAASEKTAISQEHLERAALTEYRSMGRVLSTGL